jgi:hypothetical protein
MNFLGILNLLEEFRRNLFLLESFNLCLSHLINLKK